MSWRISGRVLVPQHVAEHRSFARSGIADRLGKLPAVLRFAAQQALQVQASLSSWSAGTKNSPSRSSSAPNSSRQARTLAESAHMAHLHAVIPEIAEVTRHQTQL